MSVIKVDNEDWRIMVPADEGAPQCDTEHWQEYTMEVSPSGRYAAFRTKKKRSIVNQGHANVGYTVTFAPQISTSFLYIADLLARKVYHYPRIDGEAFVGNGFLFYWLNDDDIMVYFENNRIHTQCRLQVDHTKRKLYEMQKSERFIAGFQSSVQNCNEAVRFLFKDKEYLLVSGHKDLFLLPYRLNINGKPLEPTLRIETWSERTDPTPDCSINGALVFGYREKIYYVTIQFRNRFRLLTRYFDHFLCVDISEKKMINGGIRISNKEEATFFRPRKVGTGTFMTDLRCSASQHGHLVIITEHFWISKKMQDQGLKFWILNLEEETIQERLVTSPRLSKVTLYKDGALMLWNINDHRMGHEEALTQLKCKPIQRTDIVPSLKAICITQIQGSKATESTPRVQRIMFP